MASDKVEIWNSALIKVGADVLVNDESDQTKEARLCVAMYDRVRKKLLRAHPWNFATARVQVAVLSEAPLALDGDFTHQFQLPSDNLRVLSTDLPDRSKWAVEGDVILCNSSSLKIRYIKDIEDVSLFDEHFDELLAWTLAWVLIPSFVSSVAERTALRQELKDEKPAAYSFDAQESSLEELEADEWIDARL